MKRLRQETGQALVEFALTLLIFLTLLLFVADSGQILWRYVSVSEAARVGARYAVTHGAGSTAPIGPNGYAALTSWIHDRVTGLPGATVTAVWNPSNARGSAVTVTVTYQARALTGLFFANQLITLTGRSTMIIQN